MQKGVELVGQFCRRGLRSELLEAIKKSLDEVAPRIYAVRLNVEQGAKKARKTGLFNNLRLPVPGTRE